MTDFRNLPRKTNESPIAKARLAKGWTQAQLADVLGVSFQQVAKWEAESANPRVNTLKRIADALGMDWRDLVD